MEVTAEGASLTCAAGPLSFLFLLVKAHYTAQLGNFAKLLMLTTMEGQLEAVDAEGGAGEESDGEDAAAGGSGEDDGEGEYSEEGEQENEANSNSNVIPALCYLFFKTNVNLEKCLLFSNQKY
ncbi:uncharacterized protein LOC125219753 [Salvia hispanica]|uniref:uncharacterized protein LOC125219753 n=1 Tax=Salvia hispanica TaxID=49212 RepID=UPI00200937D4|nr:uncharacterized protein LOC125219753 [Salvia hispanica]XP_047977760.1 uncharacterized protein LOC125219753 [Salvia hispanica]XP_047977761.1 uncharacterized protein LOC125219753 [Salvia hispanica]